MLIVPKFVDEPDMGLIMKLLAGGRSLKATELRPGVYEIPGFNGEFYVDPIWFNGTPHAQASYEAQYPNLGEITEYKFEDGRVFRSGSFNPYGVCDNFQQVLDACPELEADPKRAFFVMLTRLRKSEQPAEGGWRWHKWGPYIGTQDPQCEYLAHEPLIEEVFVYQVYEVVNPASIPG